MGWHYPPDRWPDLARSMTSAAQEFGFEDIEACIQWLITSPLTQEQLKTLIRHLTIGETYFFREPKSLEALQQKILPMLIETRPATEKRLKIWSAGCSTGEEPYSIAILLDHMKSVLQDWRVTILATDVNPLALQRAAEATYREWSFRGTPQWVRQGYFKEAADGRFSLVPQIKQRVQFTSLNLAQNVYPSFLNNTEAVDIIFCRNVLMYFAPKVMQEIVQRFYKTLRPGGWLIVSPSEASHLLFADFIKISFPGAILYQKPAATGLPTLQVSLAKPAALQSGAGHSREALSQPVRPEPLPDPVAIPDEDALAVARAHANQGQLAEALAWCHKAIAANKLNPGSHYLLATILAEQGELAEAIKALKRSLYLDPELVLAHFVLGNLIQQQEGAKKAGRHFQHALSLLARLPPDEILPEADGLTAGRLMEIIQKMV